VLIRTDPEKDGAIRLLLDLEKSAVEAGATDEFSSLVDEVLERIDSEPEKVRALKRSRAVVLSSDGSRQDQASRAYRELVALFALEDDIRAFEAFVEQKPSSQDRHRDRRWLYAWRAGRETHPVKLLLEWAKVEEDFGETAAAIAVYERLAEVDAGRKDALDAVCRLKLRAGDFEGGLAALRSLHDGCDEGERRPIVLRMARVLLDDLGRPAEAALALAPLVGAVPVLPAAHRLMQRALADGAERDQIIERLDQLANESPPPT
jgi:tetratricopeptide (TPR) repeat protein